MRRIAFNRRFNIFYVTEDNTPIPPGFVWKGEAILIRRLESTKGQMAKWWVAGPFAKKALNQAPFNPVLRAIVDEFEWHPTRQLVYSGWEHEVVQGGTDVINWKAKVIAPLKDEVRKFLESVIVPIVRDYPKDFSQGCLNMWKLDDRIDLSQFSQKRDFNFVKDHLITNAFVFYRVFEINFVPTIVGAIWADDSMLVSSNYVEEHQVLYGGNWAFTHPLK
jgi:hypothetical protein